MLLNRRTTRFAAIVAASTLSVGAVATPAAVAQTKQDGLVNVAIGDITIQDVNVAVAANIVATACDLVDVTNVAILVSDVDQDSRSDTFCRTEDGKVKVTQH